MQTEISASEKFEDVRKWKDKVVTAAYSSNCLHNNVNQRGTQYSSVVREQDHADLNWLFEKEKYPF